jgi:hypothetical protein
MIVAEITQRAYQRRPGKSPSLKFRCQTGPRKGQVRASPAACNAPLNIKASNTLKKTRTAKANITTAKTKITKRSATGSQRVRKFNKTRKRTRI